MSAKPTLVQLILNATTAGKAMLTAVNAAAQRVLLSINNVDNTSDAAKPVSAAQQTAIDAKVTGPASATDNAVVRYDATTGKLVQNSGCLIDDSGNLSVASRLTLTVNETTTWPTIGMGFGQRFGLPTIWNGAALLNFGSTGVVNIGGGAAGTSGYLLDGTAGIFHEGANSIRIAGSDGGTPGTLTVGTIIGSGLIGLGTYTVATLPSAAANPRRIAAVTDSSVTINGSAVAGGGANSVMVFSNGSTWDVVVA